MAISDIQATILALLQQHGDLYGLELVKRSDGKLKRGTVYVTLDRMEDSGLIKSFIAPTPKGKQGPPRRKYKIVGAGVRALDEKLSGLRGLFGLEG